MCHHSFVARVSSVGHCSVENIVRHDFLFKLLRVLYLDASSLAILERYVMEFSMVQDHCIV